MVRRVQLDDDLQHARKNILAVDIVAIDEVSMLSQRDFQQLELVCRTMRDNSRVFGGIQVIGSGDFYQLPPVKNALYQDSGNFCFESDLWKELFAHRINLTTVMRQSEEQLITAIQETARGNVSEATDLLIRSLERPLPVHVESIKLFATNYRAQIHNHEQLKVLKTDQRTYMAVDVGSPKYLKRILALQRVAFKVGCKVMLLRNLTDILVNGLLGVVTQLEDDNIYVHFNALHSSYPISRYMFTVFSPTLHKNIASRNQFPLALAYAWTIHKAQGQTLDYVDIDAHGIFAAGQFSVALGRARNLAGLRVTGFHKSLCPQHPPQINHYYGSSSVDPRDDLTCCHSKLETNLAKCDEREWEGFESDDSDFDEADLQAIDELERHTTTTSDELERHTTTTTASVSIACETPVDVRGTQPLPWVIDAVAWAQKFLLPANCPDPSFNRLLQSLFLSPQNLALWTTNNHSKFMEFQKMYVPNAPLVKTEPKDWTKYMAACTQYMRSADYKRSLLELFGLTTGQVMDIHVNVASTIAFGIVQEIIKMLSEDVKISSEIAVVSTPEMSAPGRGKVRYVGGMCVAKMRYHYMNTVTRNLFSDKDQHKVDHAKEIVDLLATLEMGPHEVDFSSDPESLLQIARKQNLKMSLTHISDRVSDFFILATMKLQKLMTMANLKEHKDDLFFFIQKMINDDQQLNETWKSLFASTTLNIYVTEIFNNVMQRFVRVSAKQFRKDIKDSLTVEKEKAHRKKVKAASETAKIASKTLSMKDIRKGDKNIVHLNLKLLVLENNTFLNSRQFTRDDLKQLCQVYNVSFCAADKKENLAEKIKKAVTTCAEMPNPSILLECAATSSNVQSAAQIKGKGKGKGKSSKKNLCQVCQLVYSANPDWIQCDKCKCWLHRSCAGLSDEVEWQKIGDLDWNCKACQ